MNLLDINFAKSFLLIIIFGILGCSGDSTGNGTFHVDLNWVSPVENTDDSELNDLDGFEVHYGKSAGVYTNTINVGNVNLYKVNNLEKGTYYFAVTAYDIDGDESDFSDEIEVVIK